jgi:membrane associated rhomboid family serine protease
MFPLRDTIRARRFPIVNTCIIGVNVLVFLVEYAMGGEQLERVLLTCGLVPAWFWQGEGQCGWWSLFTSMFLHAGWWHLISNVYTLYIFGDNVEDRLGRLRYLLFYLLSGLAASLVHLIAYSDSPVPTVGASGAIAGVLGAYVLLYPRARVLTLVPIFYFARLVQIPAVVYLGFWFLSQLFNGFLALAAMDVLQSGGVAWWAHVGGFAFGLATVRIAAPRLPPPPPRRPSVYEVPYGDRPRWRVIDDD